MAQAIPRGDEQIKQRVLDELRWNPEVEPKDVGVEVDNGVVTLTGTVGSYLMKLAAEGAAHRVAGVRSVANDIRVELPTELIRDDTDIARATANALEWNTQVPHERVNVTVQNGWVTLKGNVDWHYQRDAAESAVRGLAGVRGVTNLVTVTAPKVSPADVKSRIEDALKRSAVVRANRISVDASDSKVILRGTVDSWDERMAAETAAWSAAGVTDVDNQIAVSSY